MAETNEWQNRIINTGEKGKKDSAEEAAIAFILAQKNAGMPQERLQKLIDAITKILEQKAHDKETIVRDCKDALQKLTEEPSFFDFRVHNNGTSLQKLTEEPSFLDNILHGVQNLGSKVTRNFDEVLFETNKRAEQEVSKKLGFAETNDLKTHGFSDKGLHGFNKEKGNYFISIQDFESTLNNGTKAEDINSKALANYFSYLSSKGMLKPEVLINKFGNNILFQLGQLWRSGGNKEEGPESLIAKNILIGKGLGYIITIIDTLSSPKEFLKNIETFKSKNELDAMLLFLDHNLNSIKDAFKRDLKKRLLASNPTKEKESDAIVDGMLEKLMKQRGLNQLPEIYKIFDQYNKEYKLELTIKDIQKNTTQVLGIQKIVAQKKAIQAKADKLKANQEMDPKKRKELEKNANDTENEAKRALKEAEMMDMVNQTIHQSNIENLISGKKRIEQVVEEMQKENNEFNQEYKIYEKERIPKEKTSREKSDKKEASGSERGEDSRGSEENTKKESVYMGKVSEETLNTLSVGSKKMIRLSPDPGATPVEIEKIGPSRYRVIIGGNHTSMFPHELPGHIKSCRLLQNTGLEAMMSIQPSVLTEIMQACSKQGNGVNDNDGDFGAKEQVLFLQSMASALGIEMRNGVGIDTLRTDFRQALSLVGDGHPQTGFKKLAQMKGFMNEAGILNPKTLKGAITG